MKIFFVLFLISLNSWTADCIRSEKSVAQLIYLHGMDIPEKSFQEIEIRKTLEVVSKNEKIDIYLPRASMKCPNHPNQLCWMWGSEDVKSLKEEKDKILKRARQCFRSKKQLIWVGFSNGGNRLNQFIQACLNDKYISIGGSGGIVNKPKLDLSKCGELYLAIGKQDNGNLEPARKFFNSVKKLGAKIERIEFDGGHEVKTEVLTSLIRRALQ